MSEDFRSFHQDSLAKHITIRAKTSDDIMENSIDWAIDEALHILSNKNMQQMHLFSAVPVFRSDGVIFVTVIAVPGWSISSSIRRQNDKIPIVPL